MKLLSLGMLGTTDELRYQLQQDCFKLAQKGFNLAIDETYKGNFKFIGCNIVEEELTFHNYERYKDTLVNYVANILADLIILREEKKIISKIIIQNYYYFNQEERNTIYENTLKKLNGNIKVPVDITVRDRRNLIFSKLMDYLEHHHELVLDGFINFRLKDYRQSIGQIVDKVADEYMMDLEYKEFIRVLRYFVEVQDPRITEVHVVISNSGTFKIIDGSQVGQNCKSIDGLMPNNTNEINYEDLLISSLITIAPYSITIHNADENKKINVVETIKTIFEGRVNMCYGCDVCQKT